MKISTVALQKFRSYAKKEFRFSPDITLIIGPNTAGKTNILEALFMSATGKSFRAEKDSDVVRWSEDVARIATKIKDQSASWRINIKDGEQKEEIRDDVTTLELIVTNGIVSGEKVPVKKYLVNGVPRRQIDFIGNLRVVLFSPEDLDLVTDSPSLRRHYLNSVLVQVDREYRRNLFSYEKGLRQRNKLLDFIRDGKAGRSQLLFWDQLLIRTGTYITDKRQEYIEYINGSRTSDVSPDKIGTGYQIHYDKSIISEARLDQYKHEEIAAGSTLVGPQRDDFNIQISDIRYRISEKPWRDVSRFGSRGEQRLAVLWLKNAELSYIEKETGERPVLLLDDIFSELDTDSRGIVLSIIYTQQTIITSAESDILKEKFANQVAVIQL